MKKISFATLLLMACLHVQAAVIDNVKIGNKVHMIVDKHFGAHLCDQCFEAYKPNMVDGIDENAEKLNLFPVCEKCYIKTQCDPGDA